MAKFCNQCGRKLEDGEVCQCQQNAGAGQHMNYQQNYSSQGKSNAQSTNGQPNYGNQNNGNSQSYYGQPNYGGQNNGNFQSSGQPNYSGQSGFQQANRTQNAAGQRDETVTISTEDWIPLRKLIGIGESDNNDIQGCFERGKRIVPDLIAACEQEVPIKQYNICNARSRLRGLWQEGKIQVTNKRILFRLSGRSWIGKAMSHVEFTIDEVAGVSLSNGVRFGLWDFLLGLVISMFAVALGSAFGKIPALLAYVLGIALAIPFFAFKKKYFIKALCLAVGEGALMLSSMRMAFQHPYVARFGIFLEVVILVLFIVALFLFALKPSLSISVMTKCASDEPIYIWSRQSLVSVMEILPGEDADIAIEELGSMIMDIQKFGDFGIKKWKES